MAKEPSSLIITSGSALTRNMDVLTFPFTARPQAMTFYARFVERSVTTWTPDGAASPRIVEIGAGGTTGARFIVFKQQGQATYSAQHANRTSSTVTGTVTLTPSPGDTIELVITLTATGVVQIHGSKNGATVVSGTATAALVLASAWVATTLRVGSLSGTTGAADINLRDLCFARGVLSFNAMRRLAGVATI